MISIRTFLAIGNIMRQVHPSSMRISKSYCRLDYSAYMAAGLAGAGISAFSYCFCGNSGSRDFACRYGRIL